MLNLTCYLYVDPLIVQNKDHSKTHQQDRTATSHFFCDKPSEIEFFKKRLKLTALKNNY